MLRVETDVRYSVPAAMMGSTLYTRMACSHVRKETPPSLQIELSVVNFAHLLGERYVVGWVHSFPNCNYIYHHIFGVLNVQRYNILVHIIKEINIIFAFNSYYDIIL